MLLSRFLRENLLQRDGVVAMEFVQSIAQTQNVTAYFAETDYGKSKAALNEFFNRIAHMPDVARGNAYSRDRTVIWSSTKDLVGRTFKHNPELDQALAGNLVTKSGRVQEQRKPEHVLFEPEVGQFVEHYIPVRDPVSNQVVGVAELYKIPRVLTQTIEKGNRLVWINAFVGGIFLYTVLFWIVRHAGRVMQQQHQALLKAEKLAAIGEMASSVAHSIRNPIASIRSSAELAMEECGQPIKEYLRDIIQEVDRFERWIRELLSFSHSPGDSDKKISLAEVVQTSLADFGQRLEGLQVSVEIPASIPEVFGEPQLLTQVFNSLIANAVEAMPHGGALTIDGERENEGVCVRVRDTGSGIPPDKLKELFTPLVSYKRGGLGLGLTLSRQIVQRYGGKLELSSKEGVGTTAVIYLPAAD